MGDTKELTASGLLQYIDYITTSELTRVSTISVKGEDWIDAYRYSLVEDRILPLGKIVFDSEYDPEDEMTANMISGVHAIVNTGIVNEVHYTKAASSFPLLSIFQSSAHPEVQFIQLDGDF
jgi:hypothetical protein